MTIAYLALGSNLGERAANLSRACELLLESGVLLRAKSAVYETQSVEGGGESNFLNAALRLETDLSARELLEICQNIETQIGREPPPRTGVHRKGARSIDIDILLFGDEKIDELDLQIPHPRMLFRAFVLRPLCDVLEGGWIRCFSKNWDERDKQDEKSTPE